MKVSEMFILALPTEPSQSSQSSTSECFGFEEPSCKLLAPGLPLTLANE